MMLEVKTGFFDNIAITYVAARTHTTSAHMLPGIGVSVLKDGKIAGAAVFNNYHVLHKGSWCEISVAIDDVECVSRRTLRRFSSTRSSNLKYRGCKRSRRLRTCVAGRSLSVWLSVRGLCTQGARRRHGRSGILDASS